MSWKRIIKFFGISLVSIIYGVVCLVAFWNPIVGIGRAPIGIMNSDHNMILVKAIEPIGENDATSFKIGALVAPNKDWNAEDATVFEGGNSIENLNQFIAKISEETYTLNNGLKFKYQKGKTTLSVVSMWEVIKGMLLPKNNSSIADEDYNFRTNVISQGLA